MLASLVGGIFGTKNERELKRMRKIVEQVNARLKSSVTHVFGGFHLYNLTKDVYEDDKRILELGNELLKTKACFFTGHCTGTKAFDTLKQLMKDKIDYISVGRNIEI